MDAVVEAASEVVEIENVPVVAPAAIFIVLLTVAAGELELKLTTMPPVGAAALRVTVPVAGVPPMTLVGLMVKELTVIGLIVNVALTLAPSAVAVIVAEPPGLDVEIVNDPVEAPAAIVIDAGTVAEERLEDKLTTSPPVGAGDVRVTVPVTEAPTVTDV